MKRNILLLILALSTSVLFGQERIPVELKDLNFSVHLLNPGVQAEKKLNANQSLVLGAHLDVTGQYFENQDFTLVSLNPTVDLQFRNYYGRKRVKKELRPNSGNFVGLRTGYVFGSVADNNENLVNERDNSYFLGAVWGIQRNYKSGIHLGLSLGAGFAVGENIDLQGTGLGGFQLGFTF